MKEIREWMRSEAGLVSLLLVILLVLVRWSLSPEVKMPLFAQVFGDFAGTFVAAVALAMLIKTVRQQQDGLEKQQKGLELQREELQLTRKELKDTREELQRTADAGERQVDIAQMAARLNATASLLDSASQEMLNLGAIPETLDQKNKKRKEAFAKVEALRDELRTLRDELTGAVSASGSVDFRPPEGGGTETGESPESESQE